MKYRVRVGAQGEAQQAQAQVCEGILEYFALKNGIFGKHFIKISLAATWKMTRGVLWMVQQG